MGGEIKDERKGKMRYERRGVEWRREGRGEEIKDRKEVDVQCVHYGVDAH